MYQPKTLPNLPRSACPSRVLVVNGGRIQSTTCNDSPETATGFCRAHSHIYELLCQLDTIGYPSLDINKYVNPAGEEQIGLHVSGGVSSWEEYLVLIPAPGEYGPMFSGGQIARWKRELRPTRYDEIKRAIEDYSRSVELHSTHTAIS